MPSKRKFGMHAEHKADDNDDINDSNDFREDSKDDEDNSAQGDTGDADSDIDISREAWGNNTCAPIRRRANRSSRTRNPTAVGPRHGCLDLTPPEIQAFVSRPVPEWYGTLQCYITRKKGVRESKLHKQTQKARTQLSNCFLA